MTTSNSTDFALNANQVVTKAFQKLGIRAAETPLESFELQDGLSDLNLMLKTWVIDPNVHLWTNEEGVIFLDAGKQSYLLGPSGDEATTLDDFVGTTTTSAVAANAVIVPVVSSSGMVAGDYAGIKLDDGTRHWTTIFSVDSATQITLVTKTPGVSASGSTVFTFTNLIERPLKITSTRRQTYGSDNEIEVYSWSRNEYFNQVNKSSQGTVVNGYYSPLLTNGRYYVWQTANSCNDYLRITFERTIQDIDDSENSLDIPVEWQECVIYNLAARLIDSYTVPAKKEQMILTKAAYFLDLCSGWDRESESMLVEPEL